MGGGRAGPDLFLSLCLPAVLSCVLSFRFQPVEALARTCDLGAGDRAAVFTMILRRSVVLALASIPLLAREAFSQTAVKARRVGLLSSAAPLTDNSDVVVRLTAGFSKRGYTVGHSLVYDRRAAEAHPERLPQLVMLKKVAPVTFPPGRLRLATSPSLVGSLPTAKTFGIDVVARLAASAATGVPAAITST